MMTKKVKSSTRSDRNIIALSLIAILLIGLTVFTRGGVNLATSAKSNNGFDQFGYNYQARIFNGTLEQWCQKKGIAIPTPCASYGFGSVSDKLVMKWNAEWDRGNSEGWANAPYGAWLDNEWNGNVSGGSGNVWHYKIKWIGTCGSNGTVLSDGGYCIWGQFEVLMDQGTQNNVHSWFAKASPNGYGVKP